LRIIMTAHPKSAVGGRRLPTTDDPTKRAAEPRTVFVAGGTGYLGRAVIPELLARGHTLRALVRPGSEGKLPPGCRVVVGNALEAQSFVDAITPSDTFLQLVGTPSPSPRHAAEFERVDFGSLRASVAAASAARVSHFVYVSVAQPAPIMQAYVNVRARGEALVRESGIPATILRPWYVLGPRHRWPYLLLPIYGLLWLVPSKRETVRRLALITLQTMKRAIVAAIEDPVQEGARVWDVAALRAAARRAQRPRTTATRDRGITAPASARPPPV
jgi:uncharacterized protein YbjT (DUF2867 family)